MQVHLLPANVKNGLRYRKQKDRTEENRCRLSADAAEGRTEEVDHQCEQAANSGTGGEHSPQAAVKADSPLPNPCDELQGSQREKQQPWNYVEESDPWVLDIANTESIIRWRIPSHVR